MKKAGKLLRECNECGKGKLFKSNLCEDCWYKREFERLKAEDETSWAKILAKKGKVSSLK